MMIRSLAVASGLLVASVLSVAAQDGAGKKAFMDVKCDRCHSIESEDIEATVVSEKMRGPDLAKLEESKDASWITQYLKREVKVDDKQHRFPWKGSDEQLQAIADWVASLE